ASRSEGPNGSASGEADMQLETERVRYEFTLSDDVLLLTDSDGETEEQAVPVPYTPARLLDPEHGLRQLLSGAEELETETREQLDDVETYRVHGTLSREAVSAVVPAVQDDVDIKFWVADDTEQLMRIWIQVPPRKENEGAVQLQLALTEHTRAAAPAPRSGRDAVRVTARSTAASALGRQFPVHQIGHTGLVDAPVARRQERRVLGTFEREQPAAQSLGEIDPRLVRGGRVVGRRDHQRRRDAVDVGQVRFGRVLHRPERTRVPGRRRR